MHIDLALGALEQPIRWMAGDAIRVELDLDGDLPPVFCDVREFENAVLNLVVNAREAMPEGGELCIAASRGGLEDDAIVILRVTDTGRGMSPETAKRAFQPRFTTKAIGRGNGLGLAMVADFVRRVGGSAQIESTPRQGTSIVLRIPGCGN
ncbi:MAG: ATP-binding protein [Rhizomicrobium sp.]